MLVVAALSMASRAVASPYVTRRPKSKSQRRRPSTSSVGSGRSRRPSSTSVREGAKPGRKLKNDRAAEVLAAEAKDRDGLSHNVTMWNPRTSTEDELIVIKHIMVREALLERMRNETQIVKLRQRPGVAKQIVEMLKQVRVATLEAVDHIEVWRRRFITKRPFVWQGDNYLLALPSSLDFLQRIDGVCELLGFGLIRNPFVVPADPAPIVLPNGQVVKPKIKHVGGLSMLKVREMEQLVMDEEARLGRWEFENEICSWCGVKAEQRHMRIVCGTCRRKYCRNCLLANYQYKETERIMNMKDSWHCFTCQAAAAESQARTMAARKAKADKQRAFREYQRSLTLGAGAMQDGVGGSVGGSVASDYDSPADTYRSGQSAGGQSRRSSGEQLPPESVDHSTVEIAAAEAYEQSRWTPSLRTTSAPANLQGGKLSALDMSPRPGEAHKDGIYSRRPSRAHDDDGTLGGDSDSRPGSGRSSGRRRSSAYRSVSESDFDVTMDIAQLASPPASVLYLETDAGGSTAHTIGSRHGNQSMPMSMNRPVSAQLARRAHKPPTHRRRSGTHGDAPAVADGAQSKPRSPRVSTRSTTRPASASAVSLDTAVRVAASKDLSRPSSRARTPGGRTLAPVLPESPGDGAGDDARSFARDVAHAIEVAMVDGQGDSVVAATSRGAGDDGSSSGAQPGSRPVYECRVGRRLGGSYCLVDAKLNAAPGARLGSASPQHAGAGTWDVRVHDVVSHKEWRLVLPSQPDISPQEQWSTILRRLAVKPPGMS